MKKIKNESGSITVVTIVTVLFMVSFLLTTLAVLSSKVKTQKEIISQTRKTYESTKTMEEIYNSYITNDGTIPIYTVEQLLKIGSGNTVDVNGKFYTFSNDATYILMNDLNYSGTVISKSFEGGFEGNGHTITLDRDSEECICNSTNNFHGLLINIPSEYRANVSNVVDGVYIPEGFRYVKGTKNTGIVITDSFTGQEDQGNEFVWVPVENISDFTRTSFCGEGLTNATTGSARFNKSWINETTEEFTNLKASITKYKGFYFGRFETSKIPNIEENIAQIKRNYDPWVNINESTFTKSSTMYSQNNEYYNHISTHLVYPHEWDTALNWIIQTGGKTEAEVKQDSTSWGNYKVLVNLINRSKIEKTGSMENNVANNIYDLAGNVSEYTQELNGVDSRISIRGGDYTEKGDNKPAGSRSDVGGSKDYLGFRICMCINI